MADELLKIIETQNNPWELSKFRTMTQNYSHGIIGKTEFNSRLRGLKEKYLRDGKIDEKKTKEENPNHNDPKVSTAAAGPRIRFKLYSTNPKEKMEVHSEVKEKLSDVLKAIEERLSSSEMRLYTSLCKGFQSHRLGYDKFVTYLLQLIEQEQHKSLYQRFIRLAYGDKGKQKVGVEETRHDQDCLGGDPKIGPQERGWDETNVERNNKKRILSPKDSNLVPLKKRKRSNPERRVTPNYRLIPEELRSPVSDPVLNNTCVVKRYDDFEGGNKVLTSTEEEMIKCEDQMFETDMLMSGLRSAVDSAKRVMRGEMRVEDLGVKFYRCLEVLYDGDMFEIVREDHQGALPMILIRLNQKLHALTVARERWIRGWKKTIKRLSPPQKDSVPYTKISSEVKETTI